MLPPVDEERSARRTAVAARKKERALAGRIEQAADRDGLALVTTDKDLVRISGEPALAALAARVATLPVELRIEEETEFRRRLLAAIRNHANGRRS